MLIIAQNSAPAVMVGPILNLDGTAYNNNDLGPTDFFIQDANDNQQNLFGSDAIVLYTEGQYHIQLNVADTGFLGYAQLGLQRSGLAMPILEFFIGPLPIGAPTHFSDMLIDVDGKVTTNNPATIVNITSQSTVINES